MNDIGKLNDIIKNSKRIVFFGGAGVSTESGIPDFRSVDGLYNQKYKRNPEYMLSHTCFIDEPVEFYKFFFDKMIFKNAKPNNCHKKLVELEKNGKLSCIITQNIDGLHEMAGSKNVLNLHGCVNTLYCMNCGKKYMLNNIKHSGIPHCSCGGTLKPDVVLYEEALNDDIVNEAINQIEKCDTLIVGGTSLVVYPAAGLIRYFKGKNLVLINRDVTPYDDIATLVIRKNIGEVFKNIK